MVAASLRGSSELAVAPVKLSPEKSGNPDTKNSAFSKNPGIRE